MSRKLSDREIRNIIRLRKHLAECTVLLKYDGLFPLECPCRIAAYGSGVRHTVKGGTGSGEVNSRFFVNVEKGLEKAGFELTTKSWLDAYDRIHKKAHEDHIQSIRRKARQEKISVIAAGMGAVQKEPEYDLPVNTDGDAAIYVLSRISGEGNDRLPKPGDFELTGTEIRDILYLQKYFRRFMLVLNTGGPVDLTPVLSVGNILVLSQLGVETGCVLADILLGKAVPSGKLAATWAAYRDYADADFGNIDDTRYSEGIYVGYRYFDAAAKSPLFPFGFGLSYTTFDVQICEAEVRDNVDVRMCETEVRDNVDVWMSEAEVRDNVDVRMCERKVRDNNVSLNSCGSIAGSSSAPSGKINIHGSRITVRTLVRNTGNYSGKETIQLYVSAPEGKLNKEVRSLAGFAKTKELGPGESDEITISFDLKDAASYDPESAAYILEKGDYVLSLGTSSRDVKEICVLSLEKTVYVRKVKNAFGCHESSERSDNAGETSTTHEKASGLCEASAKHENNEISFTAPEISEYIPPVHPLRDLSALPHYLIDADSIAAETVSYGKQIAVPERIRNLSDKELALLLTGAFDPKGGLLSIIGNASKAVPGAAGETTSLLKAKGIPSIVMADGPAGLRLAKTYYKDRKGLHTLGAAAPESITELLPSPVKAFLCRKPRIPKGAAVFHQYCTALPIGTALAQSWNTEFAGLCGDIVGSEMEEYRVQLWLAPGMNIHRNVLCGRNFEYLSEDPLVTGKMAAALTRGVQKHQGCGVTIKHFAANNQETNRYANNSIVSERALREIYLRGFEICIKESSPMAVMTSYNLLNGTHTSEREDLNRSVLRDEFGFDGIIMTDWIIAAGFLSKGSKYPAPDPAKIARAGHSLFMPGSKKDFNKLLAGLKNGTVRREDLLQNAAYLYQVIQRLS